MHRQQGEFWQMIDISLLSIKAAGAGIGSAIAVVFSPGGDTRLKLFQRFIIGTILGVIFAPQVRSYLGWPETLESWLSCATLAGLLGYLALQFLLGPGFLRTLAAKYARKNGN